MEQLNRIEIRGVVGNFRLSIINERQVARFSVVTNYAYKDKEGSPVIESTWHNVAAFEGRYIRDLDKLTKGARVHVFGRLRENRYTAADGVDRSFMEIQAYKFSFVDSEDEFQCEFA